MKGQLSADRGNFYAPYIPKEVMPMNWRELLNYFSVRQFDSGSSMTSIRLNPEKTVMDIALESFQERWPGNYIIEEYYNSTKGRFDLRLKFGDPHEETLWLLKWS